MYLTAVYECSSHTDVTSDNFQVLVNVSGTHCVRCVESNGQFDAGTFYFLGGTPVFGGPDAVVVDGVFTILDGGRAITPGSTPLILGCQVVGGLQYANIELFSSGKPCFNCLQHSWHLTSLFLPSYYSTNNTSEWINYDTRRWSWANLLSSFKCNDPSSV